MKFRIHSWTKLIRSEISEVEAVDKTEALERFYDGDCTVVSSYEKNHDGDVEEVEEVNASN